MGIIAVVALVRIGTSLDYCYKTNHYFSLAAYAAAASWAEPLSGSDYHNGSGIGVMISENTVKNDFDLGYGISYLKSSTVHSKDSTFGLFFQPIYRLSFTGSVSIRLLFQDGNYVSAHLPINESSSSISIPALFRSHDNLEMELPGRA